MNSFKAHGFEAYHFDDYGSGTGRDDFGPGSFVVWRVVRLRGAVWVADLPAGLSARAVEKVMLALKGVRVR